MKKRIFAILLILSILISLSGCCALLKRAVKQNADALKIGDHTISAVELNYFYIDAINDYINQYGSYISFLGLDLSKPLNQQSYDQEGKTWADFFLDTAINDAKKSYALYDAAVKAGHTLSEEEKKSMNTLYSNMDVYAEYYGYSNVNQYLASIYCDSANTKTYKAYYEVVVTASSYYAAYAENLKESYDSSALRDFEGSEGYKYNSYSYVSFFLDAASYSEDMVELLAEKLASPKYNTYERLYSACNELLGSSPTQHDNRLYSVIPSPLQSWLSSPDRRSGDITAIRSENSSGQLQGYYVVLYQGVRDNQFPLANVRHILIAYEGGTTNIATGETVYTDEEKQTAREEALKIYQQWLEGPKTEDSFAQLALQHTDDNNGDQGGLYEDVFPGQMVDSFNHWCFDGRKPGDHGLIQTEYGWHVVYYCGDSEITYRDYMVSRDKLTADMDAWYEALISSVSCEVLNTGFVNKEYIIEPNQIK